MKRHFTACILTVVTWPDFGQPKAKEAGEGRASDAQLAAAYDADSFRAFPLKAVKESGMRIERLAVVLAAAAAANVAQVLIPKEAIGDALRFLDPAGLNEYTMYADLDSLARELHRKNGISAAKA